MLSNLLFALESSLSYVRSHPQILFALVWVIIIPLIFLFSGERFLDAARTNQDRLQKDKVGLLHDVFGSYVKTVTFDATIVQTEIEYLASINPDIRNLSVLEVNNNEIIPIASLTIEIVGKPVEDTTLFSLASGAVTTSLNFELYQGEERIWHAFRVLETEDNRRFYLYSEHSLANIDNIIAQNEQKAYWSLALVYIIVLALAYWQIRNTNYQYLYDEARKANATKDLFTNMIAHELRAPLTAIRGYASMVMEDKNSTSQNKEYSERIKLSTERLLTIVNDLLDVARIQSGKLLVIKESVDLDKVIKNVADELKISALEKDITLSVIGSESPAMVTSDGKRLHQAFTNLVSNSIKYTKEGKIEITLEDKQNNYEIRIKDTGMGIAAKDQKNLFAPFYRVENDDVSQITGTGLGMWITRQLLELMGAKIEVESIKGVGTHIVVTINKT